MNPAQRFLAACRSQAVDRPPVWLMRQAGRYMAEYRALRARHSLLELCTTPALAAEITITAAERLGTDAAIIFADLLLPARPLGLGLEFAAGEGPRLSPPLRTAADIARLPPSWRGQLDFVGEAIARVYRHFAGQLPVLGFAGAPFTLASYLIEGGGSRTYLETKRLMHQQPAAWAELMHKLAAGLAEFLAMQVAAGAAALQLFDSWAGVLSEHDYRQHVLPATQRLVAAAKATGVPVIYFSTGTGAYLEATAETGADALSLDWRIALDAAWPRLHAWSPLAGRPVPALQGNLDPALLVTGGEPLRAQARSLLRNRQRGFIFNLGHGILPETPVEYVEELVRLVQGRTQ